jgi:streptogramin lyase
MMILFTEKGYSEIPQTINFQGYLCDSTLIPVENNSYPMTFSLWTGSDENSILLWLETKNVNVSEGIYSVELGASTPFPNTLTFSEPYYLGIKVSNGEYLSKDTHFIPLTTNLYAFRTQTSGGRLIKEITTHSTLEGSDDIIHADGDITITLPPASENLGKIFTIENIGTGTVTIETNGTETIDNETSLSLTEKYDQVTMVSNAINWFRLGFTRIEPNSIGATELIDASIKASKLPGPGNNGLDNGNNGMFISSNGDGTVSWVDASIAENAIHYTELAADSVQRSEIADGSIVSSKLSGPDSNALGNGTSGQYLKSNGDGSFSWGEINIAENDVTSTEIAPDAVRTSEMSDGSIVPSKLADNALSGLDNGTSGHLLASNGDGTFFWKDPSIDANSISYTELAPSSVRTTELADNAVTSIKINDNAIIPTKLAGISENGITGTTLLSNGDGTFSWGGFVSTEVVQEIALALDYTKGTEGSEDGNFNNPCDVELDANGKMYVCEYGNHRIQIFSASGDHEKTIGSRGSNTGQFNNPKSIAVNSTGKIYVADQLNHRIQIFTAQGNYDYSIGTGSIGTGPGEFSSPRGIAVDSNDKIYVSDYSNNRVQVFTASGIYDYSICSPDIFTTPTKVAVDSNGKIYIGANDTVFVFESNGTYNYSFGGIGNQSGKFNGLCDIEISNSGKIYVTDRSNSRIQVFNGSGVYEYSIENLDSPYGVAVDSSKIYIADTDTDNILVYTKPQTLTYKYLTVESGNVGIETNRPIEKLEVTGNLKIGDLLKLSPTSEPSNPSAGWIYFDVNDNHLKCYDGSSWISLTTF